MSTIPLKEADLKNIVGGDFSRVFYDTVAASNEKIFVALNLIEGSQSLDIPNGETLVRNPSVIVIKDPRY